MNTRFDPNLIATLAAELRDMLGDDFDTETFLDTLDGETDAMDVADTIIAEMQSAAALADAAKAQADTLKARADRFSAQADAYKGRLLTLLDAIGEKKLVRPAATVSRRTGSVHVTITDEAAVPTQLCKIVRTPDKTAIRKQIEAGEDVPGARLERGPDGVTVRVS